MTTKLRKLVIPAATEIEKMTHEELVSLAKDWSIRLDQYQGILFKLRKKIFGRSSERSKASDEVDSTTTKYLEVYAKFSEFGN
jgi:hypothetical protein